MDSRLPTCVVETSRCCDRCFYNLTGLTVPRCPECGEFFDQNARGAAAISVEQILLVINVFAAAILVLLLTSTPPGFNQKSTDTTVVIAMLAPFQWVLAMAAFMTGLHALIRRRRTWTAFTGMIFPGLAALFATISVF